MLRWQEQKRELGTTSVAFVMSIGGLMTSERQSNGEQKWLRLVGVQRHVWRA